MCGSVQNSAPAPSSNSEFGTIDVFTIMPIAEIEERYIAYFGSPNDAKESVAA